MHPLTQLMTGDARMRTLLARILARYPGNDLLADSLPREAIDRRLLGAIRVPVLIVNGARDTETRRRAGAALRNALTDGRTGADSGCGAPAESRRTA